MIEIIPGLPDNVLAVTVSGILTGEDYEKVLVPAIEDKVQKYGKIRILYQLGEKFEGFTDEAMLEDTKFGIRHFTSFEKIALVSNVDWIVNAVKVFKFIIPGSVRTYRNEELSEAKAWISE
ncbi:Amidases related to nicotinamidase [Methanosarcina horonobensis HB-1 = JCM 15518]|uniref:Amidases related to nicotinamidase n=1 Tax=Methanosarcina horonobensis HB-1 = JCM 15518 TaxID=1434110 RepID=A0A0E3SFI9_9EURY|nr:STAS/SEC14 domain-containing protein [Methanosarcina horonobensis]AKB78258.1 Amidases related to nicotinamidase [Methanosarcina horonobensis HB-1 = JCM 15518]